MQTLAEFSKDPGWKVPVGIPDLAITLAINRTATVRSCQIKIHRFHHPGHDDTEPVGEGNIHLCQYKDGAWKITRVISYDHHPAVK